MMDTEQYGINKAVCHITVTGILECYRVNYLCSELIIEIIVSVVQISWYIISIDVSMNRPTTNSCVILVCIAQITDMESEVPITEFAVQHIMNVIGFAYAIIIVNHIVLWPVS